MLIIISRKVRGLSPHSFKKIFFNHKGNPYVFYNKSESHAYVVQRISLLVVKVNRFAEFLIGMTPWYPEMWSF